MNIPITDYPISLELSLKNGQVDGGAVPQERRLSELGSLYYDQKAVAEIAKKEDRLIYDMVHNHFETSLSDLSMAVSRIQPGTIGDEYHMTKGHFHAQLDQPEIYFCLHGTGYLLMETEEGEFRAESWRAGILTHIPAQWAHRVVNTGKDILFFVSSFHKIAGHEYRLVEERGFAKVVVERNGEAVLLPNPRRK